MYEIKTSEIKKEVVLKKDVKERVLKTESKGFSKTKRRALKGEKKGRVPENKKDGILKSKRKSS